MTHSRSIPDRKYAQPRGLGYTKIVRAVASPSPDRLRIKLTYYRSLRRLGASGHAGGVRLLPGGGALADDEDRAGGRAHGRRRDAAQQQPLNPPQTPGAHDQQV